MSPDPWYHSLNTILLACSLFILGVFVAWCVLGSYGARIRKADARQAEAKPESAATRVSQDPSSDGLAARTAEQVALPLQRLAMNQDQE